jgi:hypothetical protein
MDKTEIIHKRLLGSKNIDKIKQGAEKDADSLFYPQGLH